MKDVARTGRAPQAASAFVSSAAKGAGPGVAPAGDHQKGRARARSAPGRCVERFPSRQDCLARATN
eukprot:11176748-Lingulodinium_polyedra.AAC.1